MYSTTICDNNRRWLIVTRKCGVSWWKIFSTALKVSFMKVTVVVDFIFSELNPVTDTPSCCRQAACLDGIKFQYTALRGTLSEDFYFIRDIIKF